MEEEQKRSPKIDLVKTQRQLDWFKHKLFLDMISNNAKRRIVKRGQVYWCDFGIGVGSELEKDCPAVIIQDNLPNKCSSNTIVVPITHNDSDLPCMIPLKERIDEATSKPILDGNVNASHIVTVCKSRLGDYICDLSENEMKLIDQAVSKELDINHYYLDLKKEYDKLIDKFNATTEECETYKTALNSIVALFELDEDVDLMNFLADLKKTIDSLD